MNPKPAYCILASAANTEVMFYFLFSILICEFVCLATWGSLKLYTWWVFNQFILLFLTRYV